VVEEVPTPNESSKNPTCDGMKRWLSRSVWLLAWSIWLWLGCGLYRELPRELGPATFRLPRDSKEDLFGFLHNRPVILSFDDGADNRLPTIRLRNARTGEIELEVKSEGVGIPPEFGFFNSFRHGFHGRNAAGFVSPSSATPIFVLDLSTGVWKKFADVGTVATFHPSKPWALFTGGGKDKIYDAVVLDLKTGARVFDTRTCIPRERMKLARSFAATFVGDDAVAIPFSNQPGKPTVDFEIWSMTSRTMLRRFEGDMTPPGMLGSSDGRIVLYDARTPYRTEVFDLATGDLLGSLPPKPERIAWGQPPVSMPLAPSLHGGGCRVLSSPAGGLFDVATGEAIWRADDHESFWIVRPPERIELREHWSIPFVGRKLDFSTFAIRRIDDGSFLSRSQYSTLAEHRTNADETLFLQDAKTVRQLPLRPYWLYMVSAQAILAAPIIALWAALRWRRKRTARRQSPLASEHLAPT
jgi:hypothetical protein